MRAWMDGALKDMASHLDQALDEHWDLMATLVEDPMEFVEDLEQEPWRVTELIGFINPVQGVTEVVDRAKFTYAYDKIEEFFEFDQELKLPSGWLSDL